MGAEKLSHGDIGCEFTLIGDILISVIKSNM